MPGTIIFKPIEANLNHDTDLIGKMDPYCMFNIAGQKIKGEACKKGGKHPVWNDAISVPVSNEPLLLLEVKDKDILKDDRIGSVEIDLREIENQGSIRKWYPLFNKDKPAGEILMEAFYSGDNLQQNMPLGSNFASQGVYMGGISQPMQPTLVSHQEYSATPFMTTTGVSSATYTGVNLVNPVSTAGVIPATTFVAPTIVQETGQSQIEQLAADALMKGVNPIGKDIEPTPVIGSKHSNEALLHNQPLLAGQLPHSNLPMSGQLMSGQPLLSGQPLGQPLMSGQVGQPLMSNIPEQNFSSSTITQDSVITEATNYGGQGTHIHGSNNPQMPFGHGHHPLNQDPYKKL